MALTLQKELAYIQMVTMCRFFLAFISGRADITLACCLTSGFYWSHSATPYKA